MCRPVHATEASGFTRLFLPRSARITFRQVRRASLHFFHTAFVGHKILVMKWLDMK
jgi:hypothetical protein